MSATATIRTPATIRRRAAVFASLHEWSRPVWWILGSTATVLVAAGMLWVLSPLDYVEPQPGFFVCLFLFTAFWLGWCTLLFSLNCWIARKIFG
jgi:hypothetical protein